MTMVIEIFNQHLACGSSRLPTYPFVSFSWYGYIQIFNRIQIILWHKKDDGGDKNLQLTSCLRIVTLVRTAARIKIPSAESCNHFVQNLLQSVKLFCTLLHTVIHFCTLWHTAEQCADQTLCTAHCTVHTRTYKLLHQGTSSCLHGLLLMKSFKGSVRGCIRVNRAAAVKAWGAIQMVSCWHFFYHGWWTPLATYLSMLFELKIWRWKYFGCFFKDKNQQLYKK